jgi:hypothetical protein
MKRDGITKSQKKGNKMQRETKEPEGHGEL